MPPAVKCEIKADYAYGKRLPARFASLLIKLKDELRLQLERGFQGGIPGLRNNTRIDGPFAREMWLMEVAPRVSGHFRAE